MIKMTYGDFQGSNFMTVFQKIANHVNYPTKMLYDVTKLTRKIQKEAQEAEKVFEKVVGKHCKKDENGKRVEPQGPGSFSIPLENRDAFEADRLEFEKIEFTIDWAKLNLDDIIKSGVKLSPNELILLDPLLYQLEAVEPSQEKVGT
jgi:hypothetical protein